MPVLVNKLIELLPSADRHRLSEHCSTVELIPGKLLCEPGQALRHVYFPLDGYISLMVVVGRHSPLEVCLAGNEGMLGITQILGVDAATLRGLVKGKGNALKLSVEALHRELEDSSALLVILQRYLVAISNSSICNHYHDIQSRLASWLLMIHDRVQTGHLHLTHEYLAETLGVRRSSITQAAGALQRKKLITYSRGEISIINQPGLETVSCGCYTEMKTRYTQLLGADGAWLKSL